MAGELLAVLRTFDDAGIMPVPFKGPVLAQTLYGDAGLREFGDLDLLIATADVAHAKRLLVSREYTLDPAVRGDLRSYVLGLPPERAAAYLRSRSEHHFMRSSDNMTVDLHLALADSYIRFPLSFDELRRRSEWIPLGDSSVRHFAPEDTLLVLALNGAKDGWERLQRTCDVAALLQARPELDWRSTFVRARRLGGLRLLRVSLLLARDVLSAPLPRGVSCDLNADGAARVLARDVAVRLFVERERAPLLTWDYARSYVRTRERLRDRLWFFLDLALRPTVADWRGMPLSSRMSWLYYVTRPLRLAFTYGSVRRARGPR
jgi:hypothetical protein